MENISHKLFVTAILLSMSAGLGYANYQQGRTNTVLELMDTYRIKYSNDLRDKENCGRNCFAESDLKNYLNNLDYQILFKIKLPLEGKIIKGHQTKDSRGSIIWKPYDYSQIILIAQEMVAELLESIKEEPAFSLEDSIKEAVRTDNRGYLDQILIKSGDRKQEIVGLILKYATDRSDHIILKEY